LSAYRIARRAFLRSCGGSIALLGPLLRGIEARAQGMPAPLRFLVIQRPCGTDLDLWRPTAAATTTNFTLPLNSAPFAPLQSKMVMIDGLNLVFSSLNGTGGPNTAEGGMVALMTGVPTLGQIGQQDHAAGGPSIDQLLLSRSPVLGGAGSPMGSRTPFGSLQLAADIRSDRDEVAPRVLSYLPPTPNPNISFARQPLYPATQPLDTFVRLFGGALPVGSDSAALLAEKLSVLDYMRSDLTRLRTLIPASEKVKLDTHADAIQQLEASIRASLPPQAVCMPPPRPPMFAQTGVGATGPVAPASGSSTLTGVDYYVPGDPTSHPHQVLGRTQLEIIKAAFSCDLVRVATFMWAAATSKVLFPTTFDGAALPYGGSPAAPHYEPGPDPATATGMGFLAWEAAIDRFYNQQSSQALQAFDAAIDLDGNTLLDNTVVAYVSDECTPWDHSQLNMPLIVFGGKNTRLRGGTFLKVTGGSLPQQLDLKTIGGTGNRPFNDFWLALAPIFGVTLPSLGSAAQYTGPLPGLVT
jgi:uncharacterized protein DUF1552